MGYTGSLPTLRRFLATLDGEARRAKRVTVRFETPPGHQAQADWAFAGRLPDAAGVPRPVYVFTFVLGFSRALFVRCTHSMTLPSLIDCHRHAFAALGGWPREVLYDNMRQVRAGPGRWNDGSSTSPGTTGSPPRPTARTARGPRGRWSGPSSTSGAASCSAGRSPTWTT